MKKIIDGKRYDTDTATSLGCASYSNQADFHWWSEELYQKKTGEFFLFGEGGPLSRYARAVGQGSWASGELIQPLSLEAAKKWAEKHLDADEYEDIFGEVSEGDEEKMSVGYVLPAGLIKNVKLRAAQDGVSPSSVAETAISTYLAQGQGGD